MLVRVERIKTLSVAQVTDLTVEILAAGGNVEGDSDVTDQCKVDGLYTLLTCLQRDIFPSQQMDTTGKQQRKVMNAAVAKPVSQTLSAANN